MNWRHPSEKRLVRWAASGAGFRSARHATHCGLCQDRLESLTELEPQIRAELEASLVPSDSFDDQLRKRLDQTLTNREAMAVLSDLLDVGPETSRLLMQPEQRVENDDG